MYEGIKRTIGVIVTIILLPLFVIGYVIGLLYQAVIEGITNGKDYIEYM